MKQKLITTKEFDRLFEDKKDITQYLNMKSAKRKGIKKKRNKSN